MVEIGPGGGVLTRGLLDAGGEVFAVELDRDWAFELRRRLADRGEVSPRLRLAVGDALAVRWRAPARARDEERWLVAGNLPYNVATAIIERLLPACGAVERAGFLVQREVAERMTAAPGSKAYGGLSLLVAAYSEARVLGRVKPGSFRPPPKVESAFIGLTLRPAPLADDAMAALLATVRLAFGQRRKSLRNALAAGWGRERAERALAAAGIDPGARAEEIDLAGFRRLAEAGADRP